jgi:hypothetical protein
MEVMRKLLAEGALSNALQAQCLLTACQVLEGQGAGLVSVDFREFHRHLYRLAAASPGMQLSRAWSTSVGGSAGERCVEASVLWARRWVLSLRRALLTLPSPDEGPLRHAARQVAPAG